MIVIWRDEATGQLLWRAEGANFFGPIIEPFFMEETGRPETRVEMPAGALLAVPKYRQSDHPSINKYSPLVAEAITVQDLEPLLEAWVKANAGKSLWDLRKD